MSQTAKYCYECINKLAPASAMTEEEKAFLKAHQFQYGSQPDYSKGPQTEKGPCDKCGKVDVLTYYKKSK